MNRAAQTTFRSVPDLNIAYGVSDEYSFVFHKDTTLFERRSSKIVTTIVSAFTAAYIFHWKEYFGHDEDRSQQLQDDWLPTFDGRAVCYPSLGNLRDYLAWRQVDCHINNLYNTTFWTLVQRGGKTAIEAENLLKGTFAADKNEILFSQFGINYNDEDEMYKKGSVIFREYQLVDIQTTRTDETNENVPPTGDGFSCGISEQLEPSATAISSEPLLSRTQQNKVKKARQKAKIVVAHVDIIKDDFWNKRPWILSGKPGVPLPE